MQTTIDRPAPKPLTSPSNVPTQLLTSTPGVVAASDLQQLEAHGMALCQADMRQLREQHSLWYFEFEDTDPDTADVDAVLALLETAPNGFAKGVVFGKFTLRMQIAALSGRGF